MTTDRGVIPSRVVDDLVSYRSGSCELCGRGRTPNLTDREDLLAAARPFVEMAIDHGDADDIAAAEKLLPRLDAALAKTEGRS